MAKTTQRVMAGVRSTFHDRANLRCQCTDRVERSLACCAERVARGEWASAADITFPANAALAEEWDLRKEVLGTVMDHIIEDGLLSRDIWTEREYSFAPARPLSAVRPAALCAARLVHSRRALC